MTSMLTENTPSKVWKNPQVNFIVNEIEQERDRMLARDVEDAAWRISVAESICTDMRQYIYYGLLAYKLSDSEYSQVGQVLDETAVKLREYAEASPEEAKPAILHYAEHLALRAQSYSRAA